VDIEHLPVVHLVDVIAGEDDDPARALPLERVEVLVDRIGGAFIPAFTHSLLRRKRFDELADLAVADVPCRPEVAIQALRLVLSGDEDLAKARVQAVRQREVDDPIGSPEEDGRFGSVPREGIKPLARTPGEEKGDDIPEMPRVHERSPKRPRPATGITIGSAR
jgi:hypothetical protein